MPTALGFKVVALKNELIPGSASSMVTAGLLALLVITEAYNGQSTNRSGRFQGVSFSFCSSPQPQKKAQLQKA
jgi:hypothetical protein